MAFIVGGAVILGTWAWCLLMIVAVGMSDNPNEAAGTAGSALATFTIGTVIGALIIASHWLPHIGW